MGKLVKDRLKAIEKALSEPLDLSQADFGKRAKAKREALAMSLRDLSNDIDVPPATISRIENGKEANMSSYRKIAIYFNSL